MYLVRFVGRGWVPHDEGMIGLSADHVRHGGLPHVAYSESYTGALTWIYATLFQVTGVDLLHVRWLLFAIALIALWFTYAIVRRWLSPPGAASAATVALVLSFPNYFAGLPSWWLLTCALIAAWSVIRYTETRHPVYLAVAGLSAGLGIAIKQTGVYIVVGLGLALLFDNRLWRGTGRRSDALVGGVAGLCAVGLALAILRPRLLASEGAYLFVPAAACILPVWLRGRPRDAAGQVWSPLSTLLLVAAAAVVPVACLLAPYVAGGQVADFVRGAFLAPQLRLAFASKAMPGVEAVLLGLPVTALAGLLLYAPRAREWTALRLTLWVVAVLLPLIGLVVPLAYQLAWQSMRLIAAALPLAAVAQVLRGATGDAVDGGGEARSGAALFTCGAMLAWCSLNQFPFAAPIYFCYVTPLAVITAVGLAASRPGAVRTVLAPLAVLCLIFGVLSSNRTSIAELGLFHRAVPVDTPLDLPRAHLWVRREEAHTYRRLSAVLGSRPAGTGLVAGPDCPEVYFLAGQLSEGGRVFDFLSGDGADPGDAMRAGTPGIVVINHDPSFSPPPSEAWLAGMRAAYPRGETVDRFEVRWQ